METTTATKRPSSQEHQSNQSSLHVFPPYSSEEKKGGFPFHMDELVGKVASKMVQKLDLTTSNPESSTSSKASNLLECLGESPDFELMIEENRQI